MGPPQLPMQLGSATDEADILPFMSQLTIKLSEKADALIAQLQKEIFQRRRKKVSAEAVIETLIESGAKSQSDKRYATSWMNLVADIEKAAKVADAHGARPANLSEEEWALVLSHRIRSATTAGGAKGTTRKSTTRRTPATTKDTAKATAKTTATATPKVTRQAPSKTAAKATTKDAAPAAVKAAARPARAKATTGTTTRSRRSAGTGTAPGRPTGSRASSRASSSVAKRMAKAVSRLSSAAGSTAPTLSAEPAGNGAAAPEPSLSSPAAEA